MHVAGATTPAAPSPPWVTLTDASSSLPIAMLLSFLCFLLVAAPWISPAALIVATAAAASAAFTSGAPTLAALASAICEPPFNEARRWEAIERP